VVELMLGRAPASPRAGSSGPGLLDPHGGLLATGHSSGALHFWDARRDNPEHVATLAGGPREAVTALAVCSATAFTAAAYEGGEVAMFEWSAEARRPAAVRLDREARDGFHVRRTVEPPQEVGSRAFASVLHVRVHRSKVVSIALATARGWAALGDLAGNVAVVDIVGKAVLHFVQCFSESVASLQFLPLAPEAAAADGASGNAGPCLAAVSGLGSIVFVGCESGGLTPAAPVAPKNQNRTLAAALLNSSGHILPPLHGAGAPVLERAVSQTLPEPVRIMSTPQGESGLAIQAGAKRASGGHLPTTTYLVTCSDAAVRLYSTEILSRGERTTLRKIALEGIAEAAIFFSDACSGAGVCCFMKDAGIVAFSLPGLEPLWRSSLEKTFGFMPGLTVSSSNGMADYAIISDGMEVQRLGLAPSSVRLDENLPPIYDADLDEAHAAAERAASLQAEAGASSPVDSTQSRTSSKSTGLRQFMQKAKGAIARTSSDLESAVPLSQEDLESLFMCDEDSGEDGDGVPSPTDWEEIGHCDVPATYSNTAAAVNSNQQADRDELLRRRFAHEKTSSKPRTADEVRAAYGRPARGAATAAAGAAGTMARNRDMLAERGERLRQVNERTEELQNEAANFADLAKQLADRQKNSWW
jgi:syntaxin-binding protein 5